MQIEFVSHATLRDAVGRRTVEMAVDDGATLGEALRAFADEHDGLGPLLFDSDGDIRPSINVLVDGENVRTEDGVATPLSDGDTVTLAPGVSGGRLTVGRRNLGQGGR